MEKVMNSIVLLKKENGFIDSKNENLILSTEDYKIIN